MTSGAERGFARVVGLVALVAVVSPALGDPPKDDFPLSTYPMFTYHRTTTWLDTAHAVFPDGREEPLPPVLVSGTLEVMQAAQTVSQALHQGRAGGLCKEIAARVSADAEFGDARFVRIVSARYEPIVWFTSSNPTPLQTRQRARCRVWSGSP